MARRHKRFIVCADPHGDQVDEITRAALMRHVEGYKPEIAIHAGDNWDFRNLRRGASEEELAESMEDDWNAGLEFANTFFKGARESYLLLGNHDDRLWLAQAHHNGIIADYAKRGVQRIERYARGWRAKLLPYDVRAGVLQLGHLKVVHGYFHGVNATRQHGILYGNCYHGHTHDQNVSRVPNLEGPAEARGIGCICKIDMEYNRRSPNKLRHSNGWVYGVLFDDGTYQSFQTTRINDRFYAANEICAI